MMRNVKTKLVSVVFVALMFCSVFTGVASAMVISEDLSDSTILSETGRYDDFDASNTSDSYSLSYEIDGFLDANKPVFLFFYADWCHFCQEQKPIIDKLEQEYADKIAFIRVDAEENPHAVNDFGVTGFPAMFLIVDKNEEEYVYQDFRGFTDNEMLKKSMDWIIANGNINENSTSLAHPLIEASPTLLMDDYSVASLASVCPSSPPGVAPRNPGIPSGALCRHACGGDCPSTCRNLPDISICVSDGEHDFVCTYTVITCGSHRGCREHDDCYDDCATAFWPAACRRGCDLDCISNYGIGNCNSWRTGGGPFDSWLRFSDPPDQTACVGSTPYCVDGKCVECRTNADCDDEDPCTTDSCVNGECKHEPKDCDDGNSCTMDSCDPETGECKHAEDPCMVMDPMTGECKPKDCDDGDPCTMDYCDSRRGGCINRPITGCDHPDENYDISTPKITLDNQFNPETRSNVAILQVGNAYSIQKFLTDFNEHSTFVDFDFSPNVIKNYPIFIIPTGGLYGLDSLPSFKSKLEQYVSNGGILIVFTQQHGYEFNALPGGEVSGFGWIEDQSCHYRSVGTSTYHPILSGQDSVISDVNVDGFFTKYPENATILLSRTKNGMPAMVLYKYGNGTVIATTAYTDWAYTHFQATQDGKNLVRDMIAWAKGPKEIVGYGTSDTVNSSVNVTNVHLPLSVEYPQYEPGDTVDIPTNVTNFANITSDKVSFSVFDPDYEMVDHVNVSVSIPANESKIVNFTYPTTTESKTGTYFFIYWLYAAETAVGGGFGFGGEFALGLSTYKVNFTITDPDKEIVKQENISVYVPPGEIKTVNFTYANPSKLGIWNLEYDLLDYNDTFIDSGTEKFAVSKYAENPEGFVYHGKDITFAVSTPEEQYAYESDVPFTIHIWNKGDIDKDIQVKTYYQDWSLRSVSLEEVNETLNVPAGGDATYTHTVHVGDIRLSHNQLIIRANFYEDGSNLGRTEKVVWMFRPSVSVNVETDQNEYAKGEDVSVSLNLTNKQSAPCNATATIRTLDPDNNKVFEDTFNANLSAYESHANTLVFTLPTTAEYGAYLVTVEAYSNGDKIGSGSTYFEVLKDYIVKVNFDQPDKAYRIRENMGIDLEVTNIGSALWNSMINISIPVLAYENSEYVSLNPNRTERLSYNLNIPETTPAGKHDVTVTIDFDDSVKQYYFVIPDSDLVLSSEKTSYNAGENLTINLTNVGGVDTTSDCSVELCDKHNVKIAESHSVGTFKVGETKELGILIPNQAVSGEYRLKASCIDLNTGKEMIVSGNYMITGLNASITSRTDEEIYIKGENITGFADVTNLNGPINDSTLKFKVYSTSPRGGGRFAIDSMLVIDRSGSMSSSCMSVRGVSVRGEAEETITAMNKSGIESMDGSRLDDAKNASKIFIDQLDIGDRTGLVSFASSARLDIGLTYDHGAVKEKINVLYASGGTDIGSGIERANQELAANGDTDHVWTEILLSDGAGSCYDYILDESKALNITIYTIGLGTGADEVMLRHIANATGGKYFFAPTGDDLEEIYREIAGAIMAEIEEKWLGYLVWNETIQLDMGASEAKSIQMDINVSENETGKMRLVTDLYSNLSQLIVSNISTFYVTDENVSLTLETDKNVYKSGAEIKVWGAVENLVNETGNYNLSLKANEEEILSDNFTLIPGGIYRYNASVVAVDKPIDFLAAVNGINVTQSVEVTEPRIDAEIIAPDIVGLERFDAGVLIENIGKITVDLNVKILSGSYDVTIPKNESKLVETTISTAKNITLNAVISGDVNQTLQKEIICGENARINATLQDSYYFEGLVDIPLSVENMGILDTEFNATFSVDDQSITRAYSVPIGQSINDTLSFNLTRGSYTISYTSPFEEGNVSFNVAMPRFSVTSVPTNMTFDLGENATMIFKVKNIGTAEDQADMGLEVSGIYEDVNFTWIKPGEEGNISFDFIMPDDLEEKSYKAFYEVDGEEGKFNFFVQGANITVDASLDKALYEENETAVLTLNIENNRNMNLSLYSRVKFNEYENTTYFNLTDLESKMLTFNAPVSFSGDNKMLYTVYMNSGRALYINSMYIYEKNPEISLYTDKDVYNVGEDVTIHIDATKSDLLNLTAPNFTYNNTISGPITLDFTLPELRSGTYYIEYTFGNLSFTHPFDVIGYHSRVLEADLCEEVYYSGETLRLGIDIEANRDISGLFRTWIYDPEDVLIDEFEMNKTLTEGENEIEMSRTLSTNKSGIHVVVYGFYVDLSGHSLTMLASGAEYFDAIFETLPDLNSSDISFSSATPTEGDFVTITATIRNLGGADTTDFTVSFFDGTSLIGNDTISVNADSAFSASITWTAVAGDRNIKVVADSGNDIAEADETNNEAIKTITVDMKVVHHRSGGGSGTYPPGWSATLTPTVTATPAPTTAPPGKMPSQQEETVTPAPTKPAPKETPTIPVIEVSEETPTKGKGTPGFTAIFAIAGMLAVTYLALRRRQE